MAKLFFRVVVHRQSMRVSVVPCICQHLILSVFLILAILVGLIGISLWNGQFFFFLISDPLPFFFFFFLLAVLTRGQSIECDIET